MQPCGNTLSPHIACRWRALILDSSADRAQDTQCKAYSRGGGGREAPGAARTWVEAVHRSHSSTQLPP